MEKTIRLQRIDNHLYPMDGVTVTTLWNELEIVIIPCEREYVIFPKLVARGYKIAITNY